MMESPSDPALDAPESGGTSIIARAASLSRHLMRAVGILTGIAALAGGTLWGVLWGYAPFQTGAVVGPILTLALLLTPAAVLGLFYTGLRDLAALPNRVTTGVSDTMDASVASYRTATDASDSWWGWGRHLLRRIWSLRSLLADHRALLVRYGMMLRVVTPGFLLLVLGAALITGLLVPLAALALLLTWIL